MHSIWTTTKEYCPKLLRRTWIVVVTFIIAAVSAYLLYQTWEEMTMLSLWAFVAMVLGGITVAQFFIFHDIRVERDRTKAERDALQEIKIYEEALDSLSVLFDEGNNEILNHCKVTNDIQYGAWRQVWQTWGHRVQKHLEEHFGLSERNLFKNIVYYDTLEDLDGINDRHKDERSMLVHQLETIRQIIVRHSDKVQKWRSAIISASEITN